MINKAKNFLIDFFVGILDIVRDTFETATPSVFAAMAAILPYLSPIPIAVYTAGSATTYLGFEGNVAGIFVIVLEGLGLWSTTALVDAIVDVIRSRNAKTWFMALFLGLVVIAYVFLLVDLNVTLKTALEDIEPSLKRVITLMCFIPLMTGVMNGVWKIRLHDKTIAEKIEDRDEQHYQEKIAERNRRWDVKHGVQVAQTYAKDIEQVAHTNEKVAHSVVQGAHSIEKEMYGKWDFRKHEGKLRKDAQFILNATEKEVQDAYGMSRRTISNWRKWLV